MAYKFGGKYKLLLPCDDAAFNCKFFHSAKMLYSVSATNPMMHFSDRSKPCAFLGLLCLQPSVYAGKCQKAHQGCPPRSGKKTRDALFRPAKDWQEGPAPFSWWYNCDSFVLKPWSYIQRHDARPSTLNPKCSWTLIIYKTRQISYSFDFGQRPEKQTYDPTRRYIMMQS